MGKIGIIVGPSFSGKTTIALALNYPKLVTTTSREPRPGEIDGVDYFFLSREDFKKGVDSNLFVEFVEYGDPENPDTLKYYGLSKDSLSIGLQKNELSVIVMTMEGAQKVKALYPDKVTTIFISAELSDLIDRAKQREDREENKEVRLRIIEDELKNACLCDFSVKNVDLEKTVEVVRTLLNL